jgi:undecaprenyl-diphosphatase
MRHYIVPLLGVWLISGLVNTAIKHTVQRNRPSLLPFAMPQEGFKYNSFPSGHTVTSFAIAGLILIWTWNGPKRWLGCLAIFWATLVGFSRIYRGVHWPSDVLAAAVLGLLTAVLMSRLQRRYPGTFDFLNRLFKIKEPSGDLPV